MAKAASLADSLGKHLECAVCLEQYKEPKVLPCLHSFCKRCLQGLLTRPGAKCKISCPTCRSSAEVSLFETKLLLFSNFYRYWWRKIVFNKLMFKSHELRGKQVKCIFASRVGGSLHPQLMFWVLRAVLETKFSCHCFRLAGLQHSSLFTVPCNVYQITDLLLFHSHLETVHLRRLNTVFCYPFHFTRENLYHEISDYMQLISFWRKSARTS